MAWLNLTMPSKTVKNGLMAKRFKLPQMNFFSRKTTNETFMYLLALFILQNFKKILRAHPELWGCAIFGHKMAHLSWTNFFLVQIIIITFIYLRRLHGNSQTLLVFYFILKKLIKNNFSNLFILSTHKLTQHIALDCKLSCTHRFFQVFCEIHFVLKQELISWLSFKIYLR